MWQGPLSPSFNLACTHTHFFYTDIRIHMKGGQLYINSIDNIIANYLYI